MTRPIKKGSTDQSAVIRIVDSTDGTPEQAVEHNTSGISLWYRREGGSVVAITPAALAAANSAHADGGIEHLDDGYYRLDLPDAACASGADGVMIGGAVTGMVVIGVYHPLVAVDMQDAVRGGMTALPNAAADAAGGLPVSDAGGLDIDTLLGRLDAAVSTRLATAGYDAPLDAAGLRSALGLASANLDTQFGTLPTAVENADALLGRNVAGGSSSGRTVSQALYFLRNKWTAIDGVLTVYGTDDTTLSWTAALTQTAGNPVSASDPA